MFFHGHIVIFLSVVYGKICGAKAGNDIILQCKGNELNNLRCFCLL